MRRIVAVALLAAACQPDIGIAPDDKDGDEPVDTDPAGAIGAPDIDVTPEVLSFGGLPPGCVAEPQDIAITNVGDAPLELTDIAVRGNGQIGYTLEAELTTLAPDETTVATVTFEPDQLASYSGARIVVESNDPDEPQVQVDLRGEGSEFARAEDYFLQEPSGQVDVIWTIDYSGSMSEELQELQNTFEAYITGFTQLGLDYRIAVAGAGEDCGTFQGPVITPQTPDPVQAFIDATNNQLCIEEAGFGGTRAAVEDNPGFLRPDAAFAAVSVSDEPEQSPRWGCSSCDCDPGIPLPFLGQSCWEPRGFANWLIGLKGDPGKVSFSAMVGPASGGSFIGNACPSGSHPNADATSAPRYHEAIQRTGGAWGNLCEFDFTPFLNNLVVVSAGLNRFPLTWEPLSLGSVVVEVDGVEVPYSVFDGWTYEPDEQMVVLHGPSIPAAGSEVLITYAYDAGCAN